MNSKSILKMIFAGRDLKQIRESYKFSIALKCGESFAFHDYRVISLTESHITMKINFKPSGIYIPRDRISHKGIKKIVKKRALAIPREAILQSNIDELKEDYKPKRKARKKSNPNQDYFYIFGLLYCKLGRNPSEIEIQSYKKQIRDNTI